MSASFLIISGHINKGSASLDMDRIANNIIVRLTCVDMQIHAAAYTVQLVTLPRMQYASQESYVLRAIKAHNQNHNCNLPSQINNITNSGLTTPPG